MGLVMNHFKVENGTGTLKVGDVLALWLVRWTPDREVRVRVLARSLCCVLGKDTAFSQCLSPPRDINGYQ